ncbi:MAG: DUF429 domain-containing protein, partial [Proteobacteria bacterium]|nr:DUF429 domain-containing protein [Pseudomonadota bacterium]
TLLDFEHFLHRPGPWLAGLDLPFGQPRSLIEAQGWPLDWPAFIGFFGSHDRNLLRGVFRAWCDARPVGQKFAWRVVDRIAGSSPAMRWTNPPVAWMTQAGMPRLLAAGLCFPAHSHPCPASNGYRLDARVALEAYPGHMARRITRSSYKSDDPAKQTLGRRQARQEIIEALCTDRLGLGMCLQMRIEWARLLESEGSADLLDAVICGLQAVLAARSPDWGLPIDLDPLEGWIASVPPSLK